MLARGPCAANLRELSFAAHFACATNLRERLARAVCLREVKLRQVKLREIDYFDLTEVDALVRDVLTDGIELAEARRSLARIVSSGRHRPRIAVTLGWGVMCAGVATQFGGDLIVIAIAVLTVGTNLIADAVAGASAGRVRTTGKGTR